MDTFNPGRWSNYTSRPQQQPYRASSPILEDYNGLSDLLDDEIVNSSPFPPFTQRNYQAQANPQQQYRCFDNGEATTSYADDGYGFTNSMEVSGGVDEIYEREPSQSQPATIQPQWHSQSSRLLQPFRAPQAIHPENSDSNFHAAPIINTAEHDRSIGGRSSVKLTPISRLPDVYRAIFNKYGSFNAVQSVCFDKLMDTDENLVISAPTSSGKTVLFELAMIRLQTATEKSFAHPRKCVYIAPTKALCTEKFNDWSTKFAPLGIKCCELTGDTSFFGRDIWAQAKEASIIVTTGEKWDSLTRNWSEHDRVLSLVRLLMVDEVHVLGENRGSTLEVVVSRMKMRGSGIRFILVSATVPNIDDIAAWIGNPRKSGPAHVLKFGEEYRPCKLARHVAAFNRRRENNDFQFTKLLDSKLFGIIQQYSSGKPILVFVSTRKGVFQTAEQLVKEYKACESKRLSVPWTHPSRVDTLFQDKRLSDLAMVGVGVHHAGLSMDDRRSVERLYIQKQLRVLITTSTLAVGVNLPAHLVIIKGVQTFQNGASVEYSDLDIMQMLGRAGRPQFDTEGIAVIMCETDLAGKYEALTQGTTVLESSLHRNLTEHINSEIGLGTITSIESAKDWIRESFLFQRIQRNPTRYSIEDENNQTTWQERIDNVVLRSVQQLKANQLVQSKPGSSDQSLTSTEFGDIMNKFYIRQNTMVEVLATPANATLRDLLEVISRADEFADSKPRASEKTICNMLRKHPDIRFEVRKVETAADKAFILIQAVLGGISLNAPEYQGPDCQLVLEAFSIFRHVDRIAKAIVEVAVIREHGRQVKDGLELVRCLSTKAWEDRPIVLRQIESLGEKSIKILAEHGITSLETLRTQNPIRIEALLNRKPGFGHEILGSVNAIPRYKLNIDEICLHTGSKESDVEIELGIECGLLNAATFSAQKKAKYRGSSWTTILTLSSDMELIDFRRIQTKSLKAGKSFSVNLTLTKPSQSVIVLISSELAAGTLSQATYKPNVPPNAFRTPLTKPCTPLELELAGLNEDPDFWDKMNVDETSDDVKPEPQVNSSLERDRGSPVRPPPRATNSHEARKLPSGAYECNHPCKDKTACRHYCCKNGLPKPPASSRQPKETERMAKTKAKYEEEPMKRASKVQRLHTTTTKPAQSNAIARSERRLEDLQHLHDKASTSERLQLPPGQRIKLNDPKQFPEQNERKRMRPEFKLTLADIGESAATVENKTVPDELDDSDEDELPVSVLQGLFYKPVVQPCISPAPNAGNKRAISITSSEGSSPEIVSAKRHKPNVTSKSSKKLTPNKKPASPELLFLTDGYSESPCNASTWEPVDLQETQEPYLTPTFDEVNAKGANDSPFFKPRVPRPRAQKEQEVVEEQDEFDEALDEFDAWLNSGEVQIAALK